GDTNDCDRKTSTNGAPVRIRGMPRVCARRGGTRSTGQSGYPSHRHQRHSRRGAGRQGEIGPGLLAKLHQGRNGLRQRHQPLGGNFQAFMQKIVFTESAEDALDDVVDDVVKATAADQGTLASYKRRKPTRFDQLKEVAQSPPLPPTVIAYYEDALDGPTLQRF